MEYDCPKCGKKTPLAPSLSSDYFLVHCKNMVQVEMKKGGSKYIPCGYRAFVKKGERND